MAPILCRPNTLRTDRMPAKDSNSIEARTVFDCRDHREGGFERKEPLLDSTSSEFQSEWQTLYPMLWINHSITRPGVASAAR